MADKNRYAHFLSYATMMTVIPLFGTRLFQLPWRDIFAGFMEENEDSWFESQKKCKICQKCLSTVTEITLSPKEVSRSPGRHMKDIGHIYLLYAIFIFDNKSNLGARLD